MTEPLMEATEAETEEFTDELSDEALDGENRAVCLVCIFCR